jgi:hypothetical protein
MKKLYISAKEWLHGIKLLIQILRRVRKFDLHSRNQWVSYIDRSCREPATQFEKLQLLKSFSNKDHFWIETGTYMGFTTRGLSAVSKAISSLEPSKLYFELSSKSLSDLKNVTLVNAASEDGLLAMIDHYPKGSHINFWLDGHYSAGDTFLGANHCPIEEELKTIASRLSVFDMTIFIDDFRLFGLEEGYPTKDFLVDWGRDHGFNWSVEKDIFILSK